MSAHLDVWLRELPRTGLPAPAQQELLQRLAWAIDRRTRYFPGPSLAFVERMKDLPLSAFLAQKSPLTIANAPDGASEIFPRSRDWELAFSGLSMLDAVCSPLRALHSMPVDIFCMMARGDFPLTIPPRWLGELFEMVNRAVSLKMQANNWFLEASPGMGNDCQAYISVLAQNIENDQRRSRRQWFQFRVQEDEPVLGDTGRPLNALIWTVAASCSSGPCGSSSLLMAPEPVCGFSPEAGSRAEPGFLGRFFGHSGSITSALGDPV